MEKRWLFFVLIVSLIVSLSLIIAAETEEQQEKIEKAYDCLENKVNESCDDLTFEQQVFSLLAIHECKKEVKDSSKNDECWPSPNCDTKKTAQTILALNENNVDTEEAEDWLISQNKTPTNIDWFLQIESDEETTCQISYGTSSYTITIGEDKKIDSNAGSCLSLAQDDYWLKISESCYENEFQISCDENFLTNLLYKKLDSPTIHVLENTHVAIAGETTTEKINSFCFTQSGECNYEASLWASWVLNSLDYDVSSYMPYLITMADEQEKYLPEAFLFLLGYRDYYNPLLSKQKNNQYWQESGDKYYDTALAMLPLYYEESTQKTNAKEWLLEEQDNEGCWQGNIRNTAFILYSVWPEYGPSKWGGGDDDNGTLVADCELSGYYCMSSADCTGSILSGYSCMAGYKCCSVPITTETCSQQGGEICSIDEACIGGTSISASDLDYGEICCTDGYCGISGGGTTEENECEEKNGVCRTSSCFSDEEEAYYDCDLSSESCCIAKSTPVPSERNYLWLWILLALIVLTTLGIIFKDKLRPLWLRIKSKFKKTKPDSGPGFSRAPMFSQPPRRMMPRRIIPRSSSKKPSPPRRKTSGELDSVLKKLKDMGK